MKRLATAAGALAAALAVGPAGGGQAAGGGFGPPAGSRWVPIAGLTDEFDGTRLDPAKWHDRNPRWLGRKPALFRAENVKVSGGQLHLTMRRQDVPDPPEGYHTFTSAAVQSRTRVRYGYFEIRCRPMDSRGSSAFWFYDNTPEVWTEIDVFEIGGRAPKHEKVLHMNLHVFHTLCNPDRHWARPRQHITPFRLAAGWHVYALDWDPQRLRFYLDGRCVREDVNTHWHQPLTLNFDSETMPNWFGLPDPNNLPSTFSIDYVRSWKKAGGYGPEPYRSCVVRLDPAEAKAARGRTKRYVLGEVEGGRVVLVARHGPEPRPNRSHFEYVNEAFFAAQKARQVEKAVTLTDTAGRKLTVRLAWRKVKDYQANSGYRPERIDLQADPRPGPGEQVEYRFVSAEGKVVHLTLSY